jgi:NADH-quinone oxidoreductase subunit A
VDGYLVVAGVFAVGVLLVVAGYAARRALAPSVPSRTKLTTYESGVDPVGEHWAQTRVRYLGYAFLYVVFAVDVVYLFPWALVLRTDLGAVSLVEVAIFIGVVLLGLVHALRRGLLRWT